MPKFRAVMQTWSTEQAPELSRDAKCIHVREHLHDSFFFFFISAVSRVELVQHTDRSRSVACLLGLDMDGCAGVKGQ